MGKKTISCDNLYHFVLFIYCISNATLIKYFSVCKYCFWNIDIKIHISIRLSRRQTDRIWQYDCWMSKSPRRHYNSDFFSTFKYIWHVLLSNQDISLSQIASNAKNVSIWLRNHVYSINTLVVCFIISYHICEPILILIILFQISLHTLVNLYIFNIDIIWCWWSVL